MMGRIDAPGGPTPRFGRHPEAIEGFLEGKKTQVPVNSLNNSKFGAYHGPGYVDPPPPKREPGTGGRVKIKKFIGGSFCLPKDDFRGWTSDITHWGRLHE